MIVDTYLPVFYGFYNTYFSILLEQDEEDTNEWTTEEIKQRVKEVCIKCCELVEKELSDFDVKIEFQELRSPKYYNFENDSINCSIEYNQKKVLKYLLDTSEDFSEYIKYRYTSRPGFASFHSSNYVDWIKDFTANTGKIEHIVGSIFDYILFNEEYGSWELFEQIEL